MRRSWHMYTLSGYSEIVSTGSMEGVDVVVELDDETAQANSSNNNEPS